MGLAHTRTATTHPAAAPSLHFVTSAVAPWVGLALTRRRVGLRGAFLFPRKGDGRQAPEVPGRRRRR